MQRATAGKGDSRLRTTVPPWIVQQLYWTWLRRRTQFPNARFQAPLRFLFPPAVFESEKENNKTHEVGLQAEFD